MGSRRHRPSLDSTEVPEWWDPPREPDRPVLWWLVLGATSAAAGLAWLARATGRVVYLCATSVLFCIVSTLLLLAVGTWLST